MLRDKRVSCLQVAGVLPGSKVEPTLVRLMTKVGLCPVLERMVIFDSLVSDFQHDVSAVTDRRYRLNSKCGRAKSAKIELCVIR